jgi:hypothetical protein
MRVAAPAFARIRTQLSGETSPRTLLARVAGTALPVAATSVPMRTIGRVRGPLTRRAAVQGVVRQPGAGWIAILAGGGGLFVAPPAFDLATVGAVIASMSNPQAVRGYRVVTSPFIAAFPGQPFFSVVPEGQHVPLPMVVPGGIDDAAAKAFRAAAVEHLARLVPERLHPIFRLPPIAAMASFGQVAIQQLQPRTALLAVARAQIQVGPNATAPVDTPASTITGIDPVMAAPRFPQPMYEALRDLSQQLLLPGVDGVPQDAVLGLKTNRRFVESYLVGLNVEMGAELLWRGYPTDQRGTCFAQFWDTAAAAPREDIVPIAAWQDRALGASAGAPAREQFVMLIRSALLRRYPNAIITSTRAVVSAGVRSPSTDPADEIAPSFRGTLDPDIAFFGFDFTTDAATGKDGSAGRYVVIQEHPTEPRFALHVGVDTGGQVYLGLGGGPPPGLSPGSLQWGRNAAHMAGIVRELPVSVALHASRFLGTP